MLSSKLDTIEFRLLVTGGRDFTDRDAIEHALLDIDVRPDVVIHGAAAGTDRIAGEVAEAHNLTVWEFPAQWRRYGNSAGPRRNYQMLVEGRPTHVLAFPGDRGAENMIMQASKAGIPVRRVVDVEKLLELSREANSPTND